MTENSLFNKFNYRVAFDRVRDTVFFCQEFSIPGVSLPTVDIEASMPVRVHIAGEKLVFDETIDLMFVLDEQMKSYMAVHSWMYEMRHPVDIKTHATNWRDYTSDAVVTVLGNAQQTIARIRFHDVFPTRLDKITLQPNTEGDEPTLVSASFSYTYFTFEPLNYPFIPQR